MGRGTQNGGRGIARNTNNNNTYGNKSSGQNRTNKLDVVIAALGLVSPLELVVALGLAP